MPLPNIPPAARDIARHIVTIAAAAWSAEDFSLLWEGDPAAVVRVVDAGSGTLVLTEADSGSDETHSGCTAGEEFAGFTSAIGMASDVAVVRAFWY